MIVVADTTPIISFAKICRFDLLEKMFGEILLPRAVYDELTLNSEYNDEANMIYSAKIFKIVEIENDKHVSLLRRATGLDLGESEAIVYCDENSCDLLLVDEIKARAVAENMNIKIMGTIGILKAARKLGYINKDDVLEIVDIFRRSHRHISDSLLEELLNI